MAVRRQYIQQLASSVLDRAGVTEPPVPINEIAALLGATVVTVAAESGLSGFLLRRPEGPLVGINTNEGPARRVFTLAHELGHLLLHAEVQHVDKTATVFNRGPASSQGLDEREIEANYFAAELLMPRKFISQDLTWHIDIGRADELRALAKRYEVSSQAMVIRLTNLGYLTL